MNRLSGQLSLVFIFFFLLVLVSAGGTLWGLRAQSSDAAVINLAGRQRMLIQWMTRLSASPALSWNEKDTLTTAAAAFDQTLQAFIQGGPVEYPPGQLVNIPVSSDTGIQAQLTHLVNGWNDYQSHLVQIQATMPGELAHLAAQEAVQSTAPSLLAEADDIVRLYQAQANRRTTILSWMQAGFFIGASLLLMIGVWVVTRSILRPLKTLEAAAHRIGNGNLNTPFETAGPQEINVLSAAFDSMRLSLRESRNELLCWNQMLEARVAERTRELDALYEVSREIASHLDPGLVFQSVTDKARLLLNADTAHLCLLSEDGHSICLQSSSGPAETPIKLSADVDNEFVRSILADRGSRRCSLGDCTGTCGMFGSRFRRSQLTASLWAENRVIGALCIGSQSENEFSPEASQLLMRLAGTAALAIENARLYHQAERLAALEERQRIAAAMHDGLAQTIDSLGMLIDRAADQLCPDTVEQTGQILELAYDRIRSASAEVRQAIAGLQDEPRRPVSLQDRLRELLERLQLESYPPVKWQVDLPGELYLCEADIKQTLGILQEALANTRRYASASRIAVRLNIDEDQAELLIEDNGCGFDPQRLPDDGRQHFGLKILQARAAHLGGYLEVKYAPGRGTAIVLNWPIRRVLVANSTGLPAVWAESSHSHLSKV